MAQAILGNPKLKFIKGMFYTAPPPPPPPPEQKYLAFEALEDGLQIKLSTNDCQYSLNGEDWVDLSVDTNTPAINIGGRIYFKGNLTPTSTKGIGTFTVSKKCNVSGNIMSLLFGDDFKEQTDLTSYNYAFHRLFYNCSNIIGASQLILPATTLASSCYNHMFYGCTSLVSAPALPATELWEACYYNMFYGCTSLVTAPALPATTLDYNCCSHMFDGCTSLVNAPALPVTELAYYCYMYMFRNCTSLVTAPDLPATELIDNCYEGMFSGCSKLNYIKALFTTTPDSGYTANWVSGVSSTGTFVKNKNATWDVTGTNGIPSGWTVQTA